jgi:hypothetical protein
MSQKTAVVMCRRYQLDVPYTAELITTFSDGTQALNKNFSGVFRGDQINEILVSYEADRQFDVQVRLHDHKVLLNISEVNATYLFK